MQAIGRDGHSAAFFDATARGELAVPRCDECGRYGELAAVSCAGCGATRLTWAPATGHGTVVSWTVVHGGGRGDAPATRTLVAIVELAEGPWITARLLGVSPGDVRLGLPVTAGFERPDGGEAVPVFRPAGAATS